jgi:hypothetical protein
MLRQHRNGLNWLLHEKYLFIIRGSRVKSSPVTQCLTNLYVQLSTVSLNKFSQNTENRHQFLNLFSKMNCTEMKLCTSHTYKYRRSCWYGVSKSNVGKILRGKRQRCCPGQTAKTWNVVKTDHPLYTRIRETVFWIDVLFLPPDFFPCLRRFQFGLTPSTILLLRKFDKQSHSI